MAIICPTVTVYEPHEYRRQMETLEPFAERIHIDLMDDKFTTHNSIPIDQVWWPEKVMADIHLMYQRPMEDLQKLIKLKPNLVVWHYEAETQHEQMSSNLREAGIKVGLAILQETKVDEVVGILENFDHVMIYSGNLGEHGGFADLRLLDKVMEIRSQYPDIEISWDGGINDQNAQALAEAGVDVLNVGGFIHKAEDSAAAYKRIQKIIQ